MKVNVVTVSSGWILQKMAERLVIYANNNGYDFILSHKAKNNVDANFYVDIGNCYREKSNTIDVGWFSHIHADDLSTVDRVCLSIDFMFHQAQRYIDMMSSIYPIERMKTAQLCEVDSSINMKRPVIGIFQRGVYEGKGFDFLLKLAHEPLLTNFKFLFVGSGWRKVVDLLESHNVECVYKPEETYDEYSSLYEQIDYLLIPSRWEGGPMNVIEAKAKGLPVISSDVGWIGSEFPVEYMYPPNNIEKLLEILNVIIAPMKKRRDLALSYSYEKFLNELIDRINILKEK